MAINQTTEEVEYELELAERSSLIKKYEALKDLENNESFKTLILEGYFKEKAVDAVSLLATEYVRQSGTRGAIMEELVAISSLENYFHVITQLGAPAVEDDSEDE